MTTDKSKRASEAPKRDVFMERPYDLLIRGVDDANENHLLADHDKTRIQDLDPGILASMRAHGVVRVVEATKRDGASWVVDGRRRVIHARNVWDEQEAAGVPEADRIRVKVFYVRGEDLMLFLRARTHNSGHKEESALARGRDAALALAQGASEADVAASMSTDVKIVQGYLRLIEADDKVKRAVESGKISATAGIAIAKLKTHDEQRNQLDEMIASGQTSSASARRAVSAKVTGRAGNGAMVSRRVLRELRATIAEPTKDAGDDLDESWQRGFVSALSIVLGDGDVDRDAKAWLAKVKKKVERPKKEKTAS